MFGWLTRLFRSPRPIEFAGVRSSRQIAKELDRRRQLRATYDVAKSSDDHWRPADLMSAAAANDPGTRSQLRRKARYETANNSHCRGVTLTLANDLVGLGPQLQVLGDGDDDASMLLEETIESEWQAWADEVNLAEKLNTLALSKIIDGESFALFTTNPEISCQLSAIVVKLSSQ